MRTDPAVFALQNEAQSKRPRFVIGIEYDVESIYLTSHADISGIPGVLVANVLRKPSAVSQRIVPDEGRSEIGSFSFSVVDVDSAFTEAIRAKLNDFKGLRGKKVRFWVGYARFAPSDSGGFGAGGFGGLGFGEGDPSTGPEAVFSEFQLFQTQIITGASYEDGVYEVTCSDITREQRKDIFEPKKTTLRDSIDADDTTVPVYATVGFQPVYHGASYSDGPDGVFGYIKVDDEWIRYTGTTADSFTGCTRGVLNTKAIPHTVDADSDADRRPKVEEGIYLELPAVKLAYAINTGIIHGTSPSQTLPPHWHLGIDPDLVRLSDFTGIGADLWNTSLDTDGFVVRFQGLSKIDGKKFLESELYMLLGCYSPIYSDGRIGLKRMNQVLADAAYVVELNQSNVIKHGALEHDLSGMHNRLQIDWNWNGEEFTRSTLFIDAQSIATHGPAPLKKLQFKGLHGSRHTEAIIRKRLDSFRDRYTSPPQLTSVDILSSLNRIEVGDIVRDRMRNVRDYAGALQDIDRSFEVQRRSCDYISGDVTLELFGSTAAASIEAPNSTGDGNALTDDFYDSEGTELSTVCTISVVGGVGVIQAGTYNLVAGIYYYLGDLSLSNGATLTINGTVQIRVRGFFTINGVIDGVGRGKAGVADAGTTNSASWGLTQAGTPGFLGNSRGMDGVLLLPVPRAGVGYVRTQPCAFTAGQFTAFPFLDLTVDGDSLLGIPADLAGTSGGAGGKLGRATLGGNFVTGTVTVLGGTGGNSGAGLALIGRGLAFGASGEIDLSGNDAAATSSSNALGISFAVYPGPGGGGCPGGLLILLDGSTISIPDVGGKFTAACGDVPVDGTPLPQRGPAGFGEMKTAGWFAPGSGFQDESMISGLDMSNVAYRIQYIPGVETPQADQELKPPAPTALNVVPGERINTVRVTVGGPLGPNDFVEVFASIDNDRANAVRFGYGAVSEFTHELPSGGLRYYWTRIRRDVEGPDIFSDFFPSSATAGVSSLALDFAAELPRHTGAFLDTFEHQDAPRFYDIIGTPTITYPTDGENGGRVISIQNTGELDWKQNIPYNPNAIYIVTAKARMTVAPTGGVSAHDIFYAGLIGIAADGVTKLTLPSGTGGAHHYGVASGFDMGGVTLGQWQTFRGYFSGLSASPGPQPAPLATAPCEMYSNGSSSVVKFVRPVVIANYSAGNGTMQIDYIRIDIIVGTAGLEPDAATVTYISTGGGGSITGSLASPQTLMSVSVAAEDVDTTIVVTFTANMMATAVEAGGAGIWGYTNTASLGIGYDGTQANARVYAQNAASAQVNSVAIEETFSLPAGTAQTYNIYGFRSGGGASGSASFSSGVVKAEVLKR